MLVSLIVAMDRRGLIGDETGLPWRLPDDLRRFRAYTWGKPIIMGRRTFELIGRPLPGRFNIVLSRNPEYNAPGCRVVSSFQEALSVAADFVASAGGDEVMVIGGCKVYGESVDCCDRLYLTIVEGEFKGTAYFPVRELLRQKWRPIREPEMHTPDEKNPHRHSFYIIERMSAKSPSLPQTDEHGIVHFCAEPKVAPEELDLASIVARGTMGP